MTSRYDVAWCDPGGVPARFGVCVVDEQLDAKSSESGGGAVEESR